MTAHAHPAMNPLTAAIVRHYGWTTLALLPGLALAGPAGEQIVHGTVGVTRPDANTTTVTQASDSAIVNWHSFSVGGQEYVQFVQPGAHAAILNRVTGSNASQILGRIDANGRVFLVNPQGVYFSGGAKVDTAGFAASTLDIADDDFMRGHYVFAKGSGAPAAEIANAGDIKGDQFVVLMGDRVANEGLVQARLGTVALAAGDKVTLQLDAGGLVSFAVDEATAAAQAGVENTGEIIAHGGRVLMTAKIANDLIATAVNNAGIVRAVGIDEDGGQLFLRGSGGKVVNSGRLEATGTNGGRVVVASATDDVDITGDAVIDVAGVGTGNGGSVRLVAQQSLNVAAGATVDARGGAQGGTGGVVELSAHAGTLRLDGDVQAGAGGKVVIDPARLGIGAGSAPPGGDSTLATVSKGFIETKLDANTDVTLVASDEIFATGGPFTITATTGSGNLALRIGQISGTSSASLGVGLGTGEFGVGNESDGDINLGGIGINIKGTFTASAGSATGNVALGALAAAGVTINGANSGLANGNVTTGAISAPDAVVQLEAGQSGGHVSTGPVTARSLFINTLNGRGVNTGNVSLAGISATETVDVSAGTVSGNLHLGGGGVSIAAASQNARLFLGAQGGNLNVAGPVSVVSTALNRDAEASFEGKVVNLNGNVSLQASATGGSVELFVDAVNGIVVNGNLSAIGGGESAEIDLNNVGTGNITVKGSITVSGASYGSISIEASDGNVAVNGNLSATGDNAWIGVYADGRIDLTGGARAIAQASSGSAEMEFYARRGIVIGGALEAHAGDSAEIWISNGSSESGSGDIVLQQAVTATSKLDEARVDIMNPGGAVRLNGVVAVRALADTQSSSALNIIGGPGGIWTGASGLLDAPVVTLGSLGSGPISVRTKSPDIAFADYDGGTPDVAIDNSAHTGPTILRPGSGENFGSDGRFGNASGESGFGLFGAFKLKAQGDVVVAGSLFARNALVDIGGGSLTVQGMTIIDDLNLPPELGDSVSLLFLSHAVRPDGGTIPLPRYNGVATTGPNAVFRAQNGLVFADGLAFLDPDSPYVVFMTDGTLDLGPGVYGESSIGNEFLAQFSAYSPNAVIHVEDATPLTLFGDGPVFTNRDHFSKLPGTTMIIGNLGLPVAPHLGGIAIGRNGKIDIGHQNILFSTGGGTTGIGNIVTTGFIGEVAARDTLQTVFQTPIVNEFGDSEQDDDKKKNKDNVAVDGEEGEGGDDLVAQKSNNGQMCE